MNNNFHRYHIPTNLEGLKDRIIGTALLHKPIVYPNSDCNEMVIGFFTGQWDRKNDKVVAEVTIWGKYEEYINENDYLDIVFDICNIRAHNLPHIDISAGYVMKGAINEI